MTGELCYLDASAVVKLLRYEAETAPLERFLSTPRLVVSSQLLEIELTCVARRQGLGVEHAQEIARSITLIPLDDRTIELAQGPFDPPQRALDAAHLATALRLGDDLAVMVSYDADQVRGARNSGILVEHPGWDRL